MWHKNLVNGRWAEFSLPQQMANIGSEIHRMVTWQKKNDSIRFNEAFDRSLELIDLTLADQRWKKGYKEIARVREILCDICFGENQYNTSLEDLDNYFMRFALCRSS